MDTMMSAPATPGSTRGGEMVMTGVSPAETLAIPESGSPKHDSSPIESIDKADQDGSDESGDDAIIAEIFSHTQEDDIDADSTTNSENSSSSSLSSMNFPGQGPNSFNLPLITSMDAQPRALADSPFGVEIRDLAKMVGDELKAPLMGVDYKYLHPIWRPDPDIVTRELFSIHIREDANDVITTIVKMNIGTLQEVQSSMESQLKEVKKCSCKIIHASTLPNADPAYIRAETAKNVAALQDHEDWAEVIDLELQLSEHALERIEDVRPVIELQRQCDADEVGLGEFWEKKDAAFAVFRKKRVVMMALVSMLYRKTGNADFLKRHKNELWDVVDRMLD